MKYAERRIQLSVDPVAAGAALAATSTDEYVVYEGLNYLSFAERAFQAVALFANTNPAQIADAFSQIELTDWCLYGWATFELTYALQGLDSPDGAAVMHLMVPEREVRVEQGTVLLRALNPADLDDLEARVTASRERSGLNEKIVPVNAEVIERDVREYDADSYRKAVAAGVEEIKSGRLEKVILSRRVPVPYDLDLPATYLNGRLANTPARSFLLRLGSWEAAGFSPEIVARVGADGLVTTEPLAGTRALVGDDEVNLAKRAELYRDTKEVFEHAISVRLSAAELGAVCVPNTVCVNEFMTVKERGTVQHLGSTLTGRLAPNRTPWDAFGFLFPAVTASGIPKRAACDLIRTSESSSRGLYSGAVLTFDSSGRLDAALVLRSVFRRGGQTWLRAGAGIVGASRPERELEETAEKLRSISRYLVAVPEDAGKGDSGQQAKAVSR